MNPPDEIWPPAPTPTPHGMVKAPKDDLIRLSGYSLVGAICGAIFNLPVCAIELWIPNGIVEDLAPSLIQVIVLLLCFAIFGLFVGAATGLIFGLTSKFVALWPVAGGLGGWVLILALGLVSFEGAAIFGEPPLYELQCIFAGIGLVAGTIAMLDFQRNRPLLPFMRWLKGL